MCKKAFDSLICNFVFFLIAFVGILSTSGIALRLGGMLMSMQEPENTEYPFYASESGFFVGVKSGAVFQWMTAAFITLFAKLNVTYPNKQLSDRLAATYLQSFILLALFGGLHYFSLPMGVLEEAKCIDLQEQIKKSKELKPKNPLCKDDHTWEKLFIAFSVGASIFFVGFLLLQTIYICLGANCETETAADVPPVVVAGPASGVTMIEMMSMRTDDVNLQSHYLAYAQ